jgi:hypothetical protein
VSHGALSRQADQVVGVDLLTQLQSAPQQGLDPRASQRKVTRGLVVGGDTRLGVASHIQARVLPLGSDELPLPLHERAVLPEPGALLVDEGDLDVRDRLQLQQDQGVLRDGIVAGLYDGGLHLFSYFFGELR